MSKFGLYAVNEQKKAGSSTWNLSRLYHDGKDIATVSDPDSFGLRSVDSKLNLGGAIIAESEDVHPNLGVDNGDIKFGDDVSLGTGKCINITLDNFNILLQGGSVSGYTKYNPSACYNIVDDVATAEEITWQPSEYDLNDPIFCKHYHIYNNIVGIDDVYEEYGGSIDALHPVNTFTAISTEDNPSGGCPIIGFHYYNSVISKGDIIPIQFHVDTHDMQFFSSNKVKTKFTTTVKDENGTILCQRTTYAGIIRMELGPFNTEGEHWFSIQTVDDRGVGSVVDYFDFRVKTDFDEEVEAATDPNNRQSTPLIYEATAADLLKFNIKVNDSSGDQPYRNKLGLSLLFNAVKNTIIKNPATGQPYAETSPYYNQHYMGIRLPNSGNDTYYFDYRSNRKAGTDCPIGKELQVNGSYVIDSITLDNADANIIANAPVELGNVAFFVLTICKDPDYFNDDGTLKEELQSRYTLVNTSKCSHVLYDNEEQRLFVAKKYKIAPLIKGKPVVYIGGSDTTVINGDSLGYNYQTKTSNPYTKGMLNYYYYNNSDICSGNIDNVLGSLIDSAIAGGNADYVCYEYNGNTIPITESLPADVNPVEWIYRDGAHRYRSSANHNNIKARWLYEGGTHGIYKWDVENTPTFVNNNESGRLDVVHYMSYVRPDAGRQTNISYQGKSIDVALWEVYPDGHTIYVVANNNEWYDPHGPKSTTFIKLPDNNFTIDLNDATLEGVNAEYIRKAYAPFQMYYAKNVHIKNGKFKGGYHNYNWIKAYLYIGSHKALNRVPCEEIGLIRTRSSIFCSFENLDISGSLGYMASSISDLGGKFYFNTSLNSEGFIDFSGQTIRDGITLNAITPSVNSSYITDYRRAILENNELAEEILSNKDPQVGLICTNDYVNIPAKTVQGQTVYAKDIILTAWRDNTEHYWHTCGKRSEIFVQFYDTNNNIISTIKTKYHTRVKVPSNAAKCKLTAYGVTVLENNTRSISYSYKHYNNGDTDNSVITKVPQSFFSGFMVDFSNACHNTLFKNITIHDTQSCAFSVDAGVGTIYKDCRFYNAATTYDKRDASWCANGWMGDFEEGDLLRGQTSIINCDYAVGNLVPSEYATVAEDFPYIYPGELRDGSDSLKVFTCRNFTVANTNGIRIVGIDGGIANSFFVNNRLRSIELSTGYYNSNQFNVLADNTIGENPYTFVIDLSNNMQESDGSSNYIYGAGNNTGINTVGDNVYYEPNRRNRDDDIPNTKLNILGSLTTIGTSNVNNVNVLNGSLVYTNGTTVKENLSSGTASVVLETQAGKLYSGISGNLAKYNGFHEKMENGNIGEYGSESIGGYNTPVITDANMVTVEENFSNYRHTTLMLDVSQCTVTGVTTGSGETLSVFCYGENGAFIKVVNSVSAITSDVKYIKLQTGLASGYTSTKPIRVSVNGNVKLCKNSVPALLEYTPFRFETRIPVTDDAVESCGLTYNKNTRCMDTGVIVMPPNYSIKGEPVPLVLFLHGTTDANEFLTRPLSGEHYLVSQFLANNGYAVADCSGITNLYYDRYSTAKGEGIAAPSYILALQNLVKYIFANYNVVTDGVYLSCKSIGGIPAMLLLQKQPFKIKSVGMLSPALSPIISLSNHARKLTDSANMEAEQLGIDYTFVADRFNADDKASIINNISIWRKIDGFFEGTDLTDAQVQTIVGNSHGATTDSVFSLIIGKADGTVGQQSNWNALVTEQYHTDVPVRVWISEGDNAVHYCNSQLFVKMAENGDCDCTLRTMAALSAYGTSSASTESHNVCTIAHGAPRITSYTTRLGTTITSFNGKSGVPKGICELVNWFNNGSKEEY